MAINRSLMLEANADPAVEAAVQGLVRASHVNGSTLVSLPISYPTGTAVGVRIDPAPGGYIVSDFAFGYREAESFGAERSFVAQVKKFLERYHLEYGSGHQIKVFARADQLRAAIKMVAAASFGTVQKVYESAPEWDEEEVSADLYQRLVRLFGQSHVHARARIVGASSVAWPIAARVTIEGRDVLFDVVSPHHSSVFSTVSKFNDLARTERHSIEVAVVDDKVAMGKWLPLLSQVATVIEDDAADETIEAIVSEAA